MSRFVSRLSLALLLLLGSLHAEPAPMAATLNDHMTVDEVEKALALYPPSAQNAAARALIAQSMDKLVAFAVRQEMTDTQVEQLKPLRDFYLRQVDRGLDVLEKSNVTQGVRIFKFYSSSIIIKSARGTIAVDFQEGPHLTYCGNPDKPDPVVVRTGFHWTPEELDRLAKQVDVYFITHPHSDHADYNFAQRVLARGGTVILPQQLKNLWPNLTGHIIVPTYNAIQRVGPVEMYTMDGCQYMENNKATKDAAGRETGYPSTNPKIQDAETNVYLIRIGDLVFLQSGENNVPADQWLEGAIALGFRPDVRMAIGMRQGERSVEAVLARTGPVFFMPVHEYEMGHPGGGNRTAGLYAGRTGADIAKNLAMPLFWGESFPLAPSVLPWRRE